MSPDIDLPLKYKA
jgi:hypothetical protein